MGVRRLLRMSLALAAGCALMAACARAPEGDRPAIERPAPPVPNATRVAAPVTITYHGDSLGMGALFDQLLAERFTRDTGIQVRLVPRPLSASATYAAYKPMFEARRQDMDVVLIDVIWPGAFGEHLVDLRPALGAEAGQHFPELLRNNTVGGRLVAMPWFIDTGLLYYRTDLLATYGYHAPPATWDELEKMAGAIQAGERKHNPRFTGFVWQGNAYEGLTCNALEWQVSHGGGEIFHSETGAVNVRTPQARQAFTRAARWIGTISPPGVTTYHEEEARHAFQAGDAAFMRNWPYAIATGNADGSPIKGKFDVAMLPRATSALRSAAAVGGWQLGVSKYSQHPEEALAFVRYLTSPEVQTWRAFEGTYLPTIRAIYDDDALVARRPFFTIMPAVLDSAVTRPSNRTKDRYDEASAIYFGGVAAILGGADPDEALARTQSGLEALLR